MENKNVTITVNRENLLKALKDIKPAGKCGYLPILGMCLVQTTSHGALRLAATDLATGAIVSIPAVIDGHFSLVESAAGFSCCLTMETLKKAATAAPKKSPITIHITVIDAAGVVTYSAAVKWPALGDCSAGLVVLAAPAGDYPVLPTLPDISPAGPKVSFIKHLAAGDLSVLVRRLGFCSSTEDDRHFLNGVFFNGAEAVTTDSRRLAYMPFPFTVTPYNEEAAGRDPKMGAKFADPFKERRDNGYIVPTSLMNKAAAVLDGAAVTMLESDGIVYFIAVTGAAVVFGRITEGNFPRYKQIIPKTWTGEIELSAAGAGELAALLGAVIDKKNKKQSVDLKVHSAADRVNAAPLLTVYYNNGIVGKIKIEKIDADTAAGGMSISFNPIFLGELLAARIVNGPAFIMRFNNSSTPAGFTVGDGVEYIIMPLRNNEALEKERIKDKIKMAADKLAEERADMRRRDQYAADQAAENESGAAPASTKAADTADRRADIAADIAAAEKERARLESEEVAAVKADIENAQKSAAAANMAAVQAVQEQPAAVQAVQEQPAAGSRISYEISGLSKDTEEDIFADGCQPNSGISINVDIDFSADTAAAVVRKAAEFLDAGAEDIQLDACDEPGRVDFQIMENERGEKASAAEIERWKAGAVRLWLASYSGKVEKVTRAPADLSGAAGHVLQPLDISKYPAI